MGKHMALESRMRLAKRAIELKNQYPYLTFVNIAERLGIYDSSYLRRLMKEYEKRKAEDNNE